LPWSLNRAIWYLTMIVVPVKAGLCPLAYVRSLCDRLRPFLAWNSVLMTMSLSNHDVPF